MWGGPAVRVGWAPTKGSAQGLALQRAAWSTGGEQGGTGLGRALSAVPVRGAELGGSCPRGRAGGSCPWGRAGGARTMPAPRFPTAPSQSTDIPTSRVWVSAERYRDPPPGPAPPNTVSSPCGSHFSLPKPPALSSPPLGSPPPHASHLPSQPPSQHGPSLAPALWGAICLLQPAWRHMRTFRECHASALGDTAVPRRVPRAHVPLSGACPSRGPQAARCGPTQTRDRP